MPLFFYWVIGLLVVLGAAAAYAGKVFADKVVRFKRFSWETLRDNETDGGRMDAAIYENALQHALTLQTPDGRTLHGLWFPGTRADRTVVLVHGIENNSIGMLKFARPFQALGWNAFFYDQRASGRSDGDWNAYGWLERDDLSLAYDWVQQHTPPEGRIGSFGMSMGASTALLHAAVDDRVRFVVADSAYDNAVDEIVYQYHQQYPGWPDWPLVPAAMRWAKRLTGVDLRDIDLISIMPRLQMPVFFLHGTADVVTPYPNSERLYAAKTNGGRELWIIPDAEHVRAINVQPELYAERVQAFLERFDLT